MDKSRYLARLAVSCAVALIVCGCGGDGGSAVGSPDAVNTSITGTAATGAPIVGQVVAIDANGNTFSATTSALGAYTINVAGGTAPFILTITGTSGGQAVTLNSVATAAGQTVNITPLTDLIVSIAAGQPGGETLAALCSSTLPADKVKCKGALTAATTGTNLSAAVTAVLNMIAPLNTSGTNPLNGAFAANGTGMDGVLDKILVTPAAAQGAMATVTLISVPGVAGNLGTVTMPAAAGGVATTTTVTPSAANIAAATTAATALSEIRACLASLSALYPASMTTPPTSSQVTPFVDATFSLGGPTNTTNNQSAIVGALTDLASNGNNGLAQPGLSITAGGLSKFDFSRQTDPAFVFSAVPPVSSNSAWVKISIPLAGGGLENWKMVKGTAYAGCPGGWKLAGHGHIEMHMNARVNKSSFAGAVTYNRGLPLHIDTDSAVAEGIQSIVVQGPGLSVYSGTAANPAAPSNPINSIVMVVPPVPTPPAVRAPAMVIQGQSGGFYGNAESIMSCQDLVATAAPAGTPCYDETAVAPGATFRYILKNSGGTVLYVFPHQIGAVPLSLVFVQANDKDLFAQNITVVPAGIAALNAAAASFAVGAPMDNIITFSYTQSLVYGARTDNCNINVTNASNVVILQAEQSAVGQQTSCTFKTAGLNAGSLAKPNAAFGGTNSSSMSVGNFVLGNQAGSSQRYPN